MRVYGYRCQVSYLDPGDRLRKETRVDIISAKPLPVALVLNAMKQKAASLLKTYRLETDLRDTPTSQLALTVEECTEKVGEL